MGETTIKVSPRDLIERRAYVRINGEAKIKLAHMAGAPWWDKDPNAKLHDLQRECLTRRERQKIIHGASRLGKSVLGGTEALIEAMLPGTSCAIVAARYDHVSHEFQYVHAGMRKLFGKVPQAFKRLIYRHSQNYHDYECSTIWGSRVRGFSTDSDDGAALLGQAFTRVILGEGSHISQHILETKVMRAIDGALMKRKDGVSIETGYLSIYTTPKGYEGCSASEFERIKKAGKGQLDAFHYGKVPFAQTAYVREANILENPAYDKRVYEARRKTLSKAAFEEQYQGKMTFASGRIYSEFNEDRHSRPLPPIAKIREMRLGVGIDTGAYFGAILAGIDRDNIGWILGETYTQKVNITESCEELNEMIVQILGPVFDVHEFAPLAERIELWNVDPASQHKIEIIDNLDVSLSTPTRGQGQFDLIPTIDQVRDLWREDRLFLSDDCSWTLDQLRKYIWKTVKSVGSKNAPTVKEPRKSYDHLCDALRFIIVPLMELGPYTDPPPPVTMKEAWEQHRKDRVFGPLKAVLREAEESGGGFHVG